MDSPDELRRKAEYYRDLAITATDPRTIEAALELAAEYEAMAAEREAVDQAASENGRSAGSQRT
jgi:hypothetical protein